MVTIKWLIQSRLTHTNSLDLLISTVKVIDIPHVLLCESAKFRAFQSANRDDSVYQFPDWNFPLFDGHCI